MPLAPSLLLAPSLASTFDGGGDPIAGIEDGDAVADWVASDARGPGRVRRCAAAAGAESRRAAGLSEAVKASRPLAPRRGATRI